MKFSFQAGTTGVSIFFGENEPQRLEPSKTVNQKSPLRFYVYGHFDENEVPFYIGKGTRKRAWDTDRHPLWHRYVSNHLGGKYSVVILQDNLTSEEAEDLENLWVAQESDTLINWANYGRQTDFESLDRFHKLRDKNRALAAKAKALEGAKIEKAISLYRKALQEIHEYATIQPDKGLVGQLVDEERGEIGIRGDIQVLDRLTLCLCKCRLYDEAIQTTEGYFQTYKADLMSKTAERILKRIRKSRAKL